MTNNRLSALTPINLAPVVTFAIYIVIALYWKNETLLPAQAFTSLALISLLTTPVIVFIQALPSVLQCVGNFDRIQEYCNYYTEGAEPTHDEEVTDGVKQTPEMIEEAPRLESCLSGDGTTLEHSPSPNQEGVIRLDGHDFAWDKNNPTPVLRDFTADIKRGTVTAIIGPVGSGKSSFLSALLGELAPIRPSFPPSTAAPEKSQVRQTRKRECMAYCAQQPWLENGTIRHNIVAASPWDGKWYSTVRFACCLDPDLEQLERGDQTCVGSKGMNLSGGQKQRVVSN